MILIVDDKPENILSLRSILELNKFEVDTALSGEEALKKILKQTYVLIILDVQMPGMDGFEVAEAISSYSRSKHTPIIFLSAVSTHKKFIAKGFESGAIDYIVKPVDPDLLILRVKTLQRLFEQTAALNESQRALQAEVEVRKEAEQALSSTVAELHTTLESIPQIAFTARPDGSLEFVNQCWFDYSATAARFPQAHEDDKDLDREWRAAIASGRGLELELRIQQRATGLYRYHLLRASPVLRDGAPVKWVGTFTDIHEQKMLSELLENKVEERTRALIAANRELEETNNDLQQFTAIASHDLKEPLRKIQFFGSRVIETLGDRADDVVQYLQKINQSSNRMSRLIDDVLNFSKLSQANLFAPTDLNAVLDELVVDLELLIRDTGARIDRTPLPMIDANAGLMRQAFQNIISNALKFSRPGVPPEIRITGETVEALDAHAAATPDGPFCRISIADNGIGFDVRYLAKIFSIFQRLHTRDKYEGTGIGLAITKKIVQKHQGTITATSREGEGSCFIIVVPVRQAVTEANQTDHISTS
ncbi:MAG: histidine kinase [Flaviaesturariibacter sp.]|nr:histidine kinase [Flaviaesturariibacter sp.]